jgi:hypothetical protein
VQWPVTQCHRPITDTAVLRAGLTGGRRKSTRSNLEKSQGSNADAKKVADKLIADHTAMARRSWPRRQRRHRAGTGHDHTG